MRARPAAVLRKRHAAVAADGFLVIGVSAAGISLVIGVGAAGISADRRFDDLHADPAEIPRSPPALDYNSNLVRSPSGLPQLCQIVATSYTG